MYNVIRENLAKSTYKAKNKILTGENTLESIQLIQSLLDMINSSDIGGIFLGFATPSTVPNSQINGFYFSNGNGTYINFIGRNNTPIVIEDDLEIIYCVKEGDNFIWEHESVQEDFEIDSVSISDINNITRF